MTRLDDYIQHKILELMDSSPDGSYPTNYAICYSIITDDSRPNFYQCECVPRGAIIEDIEEGETIEFWFD